MEIILSELTTLTKYFSPTIENDGVSRRGIYEDKTRQCKSLIEDRRTFLTPKI